MLAFKRLNAHRFQGFGYNRQPAHQPYNADDCNAKAPPCKSPNSPRFKNVMSTWGTGAAYFSTFVSTVKTAFKSKTMVVIAEPKVRRCRLTSG